MDMLQDKDGEMEEYRTLMNTYVVEHSEVSVLISQATSTNLSAFRSLLKRKNNAIRYVCDKNVFRIGIHSPLLVFSCPLSYKLS